MVTIGQLTKATALALRISEATAAVFARNLRDAGLLTSGGRGPSAAQMTPRDVARLWLSFLTVDRSEPRRAVDGVLFYSGLPYVGIHRGSPKPKRGQLNFIRDFDLPQEHSFEDALTRLIEAREGSSKYKEILEKHSWGSPIKMLPVLTVDVGDTFFDAHIAFGGITYLYSDGNSLIALIEGRGPGTDLRGQILRRFIADRGPGEGTGLRTTRRFTWAEIDSLREHLRILQQEVRNPVSKKKRD